MNISEAAMEGLQIIPLSRLEHDTTYRVTGVRYIDTDKGWTTILELNNSLLIPLLNAEELYHDISELLETKDEVWFYNSNGTTYGLYGNNLD